jgi:hypothetical protein
MNLLSSQPPESNSPSKIISDKEEKSTIENESIQSIQYIYKPNSFSLTNIQMLQVIGILEQFKPNSICEFGTGITTDVFESYCKKYNKNLLNIEHNIKYQREHSKLFKLNKKKDVVINNIKYSQTNIYEGLEEFFKSYDKKFDFVLIDAPIGETNKYKYGRIQMIDLIVFDLLDDEGYFLVHNTEKHCIQNSVNVLLSLFKKKNYNTVIENLGYNNNKRLTIIHFKKSK